MGTLDVVNHRLHNQRLAGSPLERPEEVVRWLGAVQSQDYLGAKWGVAQRTTGTTSAEIDRLFADGAILRTHVMRPTWHFVTPDDIRWLLDLTGPRVHAANAYYYRKLELDDATFRQSDALLADALQHGKHLTRAELADIFRRNGIDASGPRLACLIMHAELDAIICSGPLRGKQFTYALLDERAPGARVLPRDQAMAELTIRYFASHGPATAHDFAWWSGLTVSVARTGIEMAKSQLVGEAVGETTLWFAPSVVTDRPITPVAHLLPNYDEYLVAYKDRTAFFDADVYGKLNPAVNPLMAHIVVIDGLVTGSWQRIIGKREAIITTNFLKAPGQAEWDALRGAVEGFSRFLGLPVRFEEGAS